MSSLSFGVTDHHRVLLINRFNGNYGIFGLVDWLHGTDKLFRKSPYLHSYKMYFSLTPPKELHLQHKFE